MGKRKEFASPEELEAAASPQGVPLSGMDRTFMLPYYESVEDVTQRALNLNTPTVDYDHELGEELLEEKARLEQGPPHRSLRGYHDEFKFRTEEYYLSLQEWAQKVKERKKAAEEGGKKKTQKRRRRKPKPSAKIVGFRLIERESIEVEQQEPAKIIKIVDERDRIENLRCGALPAGFRSNRRLRR